MRVRLSTNGLRTIEHNGGLDAWLLGTAITKLDPEMRRLRRVERAKVRRAAA